MLPSTRSGGRRADSLARAGLNKREGSESKRADHVVGSFACGEPDMGCDLEVKVLSELDRKDRSEPQGVALRGRR
jgi:hypothetical protein